MGDAMITYHGRHDEKITVDAVATALWAVSPRREKQRRVNWPQAGGYSIL
jgi:hypothetical protein